MSVLRWGGLDFDTSELDTEIRVLLASIAPDGGSLHGLSLTARVRDAHRAAIWDLSLIRSQRQAALGEDLEDETTQEQALSEAITLLDCLAAAQAQLFEAHESLRRAERLIGGGK